MIEDNFNKVQGMVRDIADILYNSSQLQNMVDVFNTHNNGKKIDLTRDIEIHIEGDNYALIVIHFDEKDIERMMVKGIEYSLMRAVIRELKLYDAVDDYESNVDFYSNDMPGYTREEVIDMLLEDEDRFDFIAYHLGNTYAVQ